MDSTSIPEITQDDILKWSAHARPLPLPLHLTPLSGTPLQEITDDVLLTVPPHMISHVQRTAAQGGLQIVSPRQTPFSALMVRTPGGRRQIGDHVVGSIADPEAVWPTIDDDELSALLPDEPLPTQSSDRAVREKTRTTPLTSAGHYLSDPILACLVKGRAVIDILRRDDVAGGADNYTEVLAKAWGIAKADIDDLDAFTLGVQGPLLRHAIKVDEVYSTIYAPIHIRRCISVGSSEVTRHYLPDDSAMDWRRMRVFCEAVFALTCAIEGYPVKVMRAIPPPGDPAAPSNRPNVMVFQPAPGSAWTFEASSFSLFPLSPSKYMTSSAIPRDVMEALARYTSVVKPVSYAMTMGHVPHARRTTTIEVANPVGETISDSYRYMVLCLTLGSARGKNAASSIRNLIFNALDEASPNMRLRIVRYLRTAQTECVNHLGVTAVPDRLIQRISDKFLAVGDVIRLKVASEAVKRGHSVEEWWNDIISQTPERYKMFAEGTKGWAMVAFWLLFRAPTEKWSRLSAALQFSALREAEVRGIGSMSLPAEKGSPERLLAAARAGVKNLTIAYSGFYMGVADVGLAMADVAIEMNRSRTAEVLKEAAYLWVLRARSLRGTNVTALAKNEVTTNPLHFRVVAQPTDLLLVPAPYRAFKAYQEHVKSSTILRSDYKKHIAEVTGGALSNVFRNWGQHICPVKSTVLTRYLANAGELGNDMEASWRMLVQDIEKIAAIYGSNERVRAPSPIPKKQKIIPSEHIEVNMTQDLTGGMDYWSVLAVMDEDEVEWIEDLMSRLGPAFEGMFCERKFESVEQVRRELQQADRENQVERVVRLESVR